MHAQRHSSSHYLYLGHCFNSLDSPCATPNVHVNMLRQQLTPIVLAVLLSPTSATNTVNGSVEATAIVVNASAGSLFRNFWASCGWCPPLPHEDMASFFLQEDQRQNHALIGSVPHGGIT